MTPYLSRIVRGMAIIQHAGSDSLNLNNRVNFATLLGGQIPTLARTDVYFSSRAEIETWMKCFGIWFSLCRADRTVADISDVFIEKYAMSDAEARDVKAVMQGHDYITQSTWLLWPKQ